MKTTRVDLDEVRWLRYGSNDITAFERMAGGKGWQTALVEMGETNLRLILWAGLRHREGTITPDKVGAMLDGAREKGISVVAIWEQIMLALQENGFLPQAVQDGNPTTTDGSTPAPSPGAPTA